MLALIRMADLHNIMHASNPSTGDALLRVLEKGVKDPSRIPCFYDNQVSPAVEWHVNHPTGCLYDKRAAHRAQLYKMAACAGAGAAAAAVAIKFLKP